MEKEMSHSMNQVSLPHSQNCLQIAYLEHSQPQMPKKMNKLGNYRALCLWWAPPNLCGDLWLDFPLFFIASWAHRQGAFVKHHVKKVLKAVKYITKAYPNVKQKYGCRLYSRAQNSPKMLSNDPKTTYILST